MPPSGKQRRSHSPFVLLVALVVVLVYLFVPFNCKPTSSASQSAFCATPSTPRRSALTQHMGRTTSNHHQGPPIDYSLPDSLHASANSISRSLHRGVFGQRIARAAPNPSDYIEKIIAVESTLSELASASPTATTSDSENAFPATTSFTSPSIPPTPIFGNVHHSSLRLTSISSAPIPSGSAIQNYLFPMPPDADPSPITQITRPDAIAVIIMVVVFFSILTVFFIPRTKSRLVHPPTSNSFLPSRSRSCALDEDLERGPSKEDVERVRDGLETFKFPRPEPALVDIPLH